MKFFRIAISICALFLLASAAFGQEASQAAPTTELSMTSDAGDYIGGGQNYYYPPGTGNYTAQAADQNGDGVVDFVEFRYTGGSDWTIDFSSRRTGRPIAAGFYDNAMRYPFESGTSPGLSVYGNGRGCNQLIGNFTVHDAEFNYQSTPIQIVRFAATFEQHCEGGPTAFYGTIFYNYESTGPTFTVSGRVVDNNGNPLAGTAIGLFGSRTRSATTDADGRFAFGQLFGGGTYRVVPTSTGYSPSPTNRLFKALAADQPAADFTLVPFYNITGRVVNDQGSALTGVTVRLTGTQTQTATTDADGRYAFNTLIANGNYTVTPSRTFYAFTPPQKSYTGLPANTTADFTGSVARYSISGRVLNNVGASLSGVRVDLEGGPQLVTTTTDANGTYSFENIQAGSDYRVRPVNSGYNYTPQVQYFYSLDRSYSNVLFTGTVGTRFTISGFVLDRGGVGVANALVALSGTSTAVATTDAYGFYSFPYLPSGSPYAVTATKQGYTFSPPSRSTSSLDADVFFNFVGAFQPGAARTRFDFDGDGRADLAVRRPSDNTWYLQRSTAGYTAQTWGQAGDLAAPADYDGDGRTDVAVFRPGSGQWFVAGSAAGFYTVTWGMTGDLPVPSDYDGDGKADIAVYRPADGTWYRKLSNGDVIANAVFGTAEDKPLPGDLDGDGKADLAVRRPSDNTWYFLRTSAGFTAMTWGQSGDVSVPADYDGDARIDPAVFRPSTGVWYVAGSSAGFFTWTWGVAGDVPVPADYDGDGKTDPAVFRPSDQKWYLRMSRDGMASPYFGEAADRPVPSMLTY